MHRRDRKIYSAVWVMIAGFAVLILLAAAAIKAAFLLLLVAGVGLIGFLRATHPLGARKPSWRALLAPDAGEGRRPPPPSAIAGSASTVVRQDPSPAERTTEPTDRPVRAGDERDEHDEHDQHGEHDQPVDRDVTEPVTSDDREDDVSPPTPPGAEPDPDHAIGPLAVLTPAEALPNREPSQRRAAVMAPMAWSRAATDDAANRTTRSLFARPPEAPGSAGVALSADDERILAVSRAAAMLRAAREVSKDMAEGHLGLLQRVRGHLEDYA